MQNIVPHLWFNKEAKEAAEFYVGIFNSQPINNSLVESKITNINTIVDTPSGDCDIVSFDLAGQSFMAISAGPHFKLNPSASFFVTFDSEAEIEAAWAKLIDGGMAMMAYDTYPWANKYGWLNDKYGMSWQLSWNENNKTKQKITPAFMFTQSVAGKAKEAIEEYVNIFPESKIELMVPYEKGDDDQEGFIKHSRFTLMGQDFIAMDSSLSHKFIFNEAFSLIVNCQSQKEVDYYWDKLSAVKEAEQCGWLKDKYGMSWQIVPSLLGKLMGSGDQVKSKRVMDALMKMHKIETSVLQAAYDQE